MLTDFNTNITKITVKILVMVRWIIEIRLKILDMVEKPFDPKTEWGIYAAYFYSRRQSPPSDTPGNFPSWLYKIMPVYAYKGEGECIDIGTPENYAQTCEAFKDR